MGVSYSIVPKCEVQDNSGWKEHILNSKIIGKPEFWIREEGNNFPTLTEIYESIKEANINIESEKKKMDSLKLKEGKKEFVHSLEIKDDRAKFASNFTMRYPESANEEYRIKNLLGIKSDFRILIKLFSWVSKKCGSFFIVSPYESFFVDKNNSYEEIWKEVEKYMKEN